MIPFVDKILESIDQFHKIIGPPLLAAIIMFGVLGYWILDLYKFNVTHKIEGAFPSQFTLIFYFCFSVGMIVLVIGILIFQAQIFKRNSNPPTNLDSTSASA
jgi:hypothetical protein